MIIAHTIFLELIIRGKVYYSHLYFQVLYQFFSCKPKHSFSLDRPDDVRIVHIYRLHTISLQIKSKLKKI